MMASASPFVKLPGLPARAATAGRRWRLARVGVAVLAVLAVAVALAGFHAQRNTERAPAPAAAVWAVAELEVDLANLRIAVARALGSEGDPAALADLRRAYDILFSRAVLLGEGQLAPQVDVLGTADPQGGVATLVAEMLPLVDGPDASLAGALPDLVDRIETVQAATRTRVVAAVGDLSHAADMAAAPLAGPQPFYLAAIVLALATAAGALFVAGRERRLLTARAEAGETEAGTLRALQAAAGPIAVFDSRGLLIEVNPAAAALLRLRPEEATGLSAADLLIAPDTADEADRAAGIGGLADLLRRDPGLVMPARLRRGDGRLVPVEISQGRARAGNGDILHVLTLHDTASVQSREVALRRDLSRAEDEARSARNDADLTRLEAGFVLDSLMAAVARGRLPTPAEGTRIAAALAATGLARGADAAGTDRSAPFDPLADIAAAVALVRPLAEERGIAISAELPAAVPVLRGARGAFVRAVTGLLARAVAVPGPARVRLHLGVRTAPDGHVELEFTVADPGVEGVPGVLYTATDGTVGLPGEPERTAALALRAARAGATALGGRVVLRREGAEAQAAVLSITLPRADADAARPPRLLHVLVVDDSDANRQHLAGMLSHAGHRVDCAAGGSEGADMAVATPYDLILMDVAMPEVDGVAATRRIRAGGASTGAPVIGVTAHAALARLPSLIAAGMNEVLARPLSRAALLAAMARHTQTAADEPRPDPTGRKDTDMTPAEGATPQDFARDVLEEAVDIMGRDAITATVARFAAEAQAALPRIASLHAAGDTAEAARLAHKTGGGAAVLGLTGLRAALIGYERAIHAGEAQAAAAELARAGALLPHALDYLRSEGLLAPA